MRERVLDAAEKLVQERGLNAVSFQQLATEVGLSKPSVFHHFPNKEALAKALLDRCQTKYGVEYGEVIDGDGSAPEKVWAIARIFEAGVRTDRPCLLGTLAHGVATLTEPTQGDLQHSIGRTLGRYSRVFEQGRREGTLRVSGEPTDAAAAFLAMMEGLQVLARAKNDPDLFLRAARTYLEALTP